MPIVIIFLVRVPSFPFSSVGVLGTQYVLYLVHPLSTLVFAFLMLTAKTSAKSQVCFVNMYVFLNTAVFKMAGPLHMTDILRYGLQKEL